MRFMQYAKINSKKNSNMQLRNEWKGQYSMLCDDKHILIGIKKNVKVFIFVIIRSKKSTNMEQ